jgi:hypothetical protein
MRARAERINAQSVARPAEFSQQSAYQPLRLPRSSLLTAYLRRHLRRAEAQVRVQRVVSPDDETESWTVLADDWTPVEPVELFLAHLTDQERSPNTVKAYAHDLKDYFEYLEGRQADWRRLRFDELAAGFKPWLRLSPAQRRGGVAWLARRTSGQDLVDRSADPDQDCGRTGILGEFLGDRSRSRFGLAASI